MKTARRWIKFLLDYLDEYVDEKTRVEMLENCGRNCISSSYVEKAKSCKDKAKDMDDFLSKLSKIWGPLQREGEDVYVVYEKCYCPLGRTLLKDYADSLSSSFCNCGRGWIKELFESALERPVEVKLETSVIQGNAVCKFKVCL